MVKLKALFDKKYKIYTFYQYTGGNYRGRDERMGWL